jgi:cell division protein FtsB
MFMDDTKKMFKAIINGQSVMKSELLARIDSLDKKLTNRVDNLENKMNEEFKKLTKRVDMIGLQVAKLEDDTPTIEEYDKLEKRVTKIEQKVASL